MSEETKTKKERDPNANAVSKWSMAKQECDRITDLFAKIDNHAMNAHAGNTVAMFKYYGGLKCAYAAVSTFVRTDNVTAITEKFNEAKNGFAKADVRANITLKPAQYGPSLERLDEIYELLIKSAQIGGLRFPLKSKPKAHRIKGILA